jgi:hypothetical protein
VVSVGRKNLSNSKTFNHPQKIVCYKLTLVQWLLTLRWHLYIMGTLTFTKEKKFNFNNPQSSQKRQSDDSGLQIAKTKYKRILPLSFSDSDSEWTLAHFPSVIIRLNYRFNVWTIVFGCMRIKIYNRLDPHTFCITVYIS